MHTYILTYVHASKFEYAVSAYDSSKIVETNYLQLLQSLENFGVIN